MRKFIALLLTAVILLLCSCSHRQADSTEATRQTGAPLPIKQAETISDTVSSGWDASLLPESFAKQPEGSVVISTKRTTSSDYYGEVTLIVLQCLPEQMQLFSADLVFLGYIGGIRFYNDDAKYDDGVVGYWTNDEYLIIVSDDEKLTDSDSGMEYSLTLNIAKCKNALPDILSQGFPGFSGGWTRNTGIYQGDNDFGVHSDTPDARLSDTTWLWTFEEEDAFVGVTEEEFDAYVAFLANSGFDCFPEYENDSFGEIKYLSAEYKYEGDTFGIYLCYITYLSSLEMIFSNDITSYYS